MLFINKSISAVEIRDCHGRVQRFDATEDRQGTENKIRTAYPAMTHLYTWTDDVPELFSFGGLLIRTVMEGQDRVPWDHPEPIVVQPNLVRVELRIPEEGGFREVTFYVGDGETVPDGLRFNRSDKFSLEDSPLVVRGHRGFKLKLTQVAFDASRHYPHHSNFRGMDIQKYLSIQEKTGDRRSPNPIHLTDQLGEVHVFDSVLKASAFANVGSITIKKASDGNRVLRGGFLVTWYNGLMVVPAGEAVEKIKATRSKGSFNLVVCDENDVVTEIHTSIADLCQVHQLGMDVVGSWLDKEGSVLLPEGKKILRARHPVFIGDKPDYSSLEEFGCPTYYQPE